MRIWIFVMIMHLCRCHAPLILGGPTPATTTHPCDTGGTCPDGYDCPPLSNPTGPCEAPDPPTVEASYRVHPARDAALE